LPPHQKNREMCPSLSFGQLLGCWRGGAAGVEHVLGGLSCINLGNSLKDKKKTK
jgi:hypothetical protein